MRHHLLRYAPFAVVLLATASLRAAFSPPQQIDRRLPTPTRAARQVILVSIDGLGSHLLARARAPRLTELARQGLALEATSVKPTWTLPAHFSMLSGLQPAQHEVLWNEYRPFKKLHIPTVFTYCANAGIRCGLFAGKEKFAHFAEEEPGVQHYELQQNTPAILLAARTYFATKDPDLTVIHLPEVDEIGHEMGWASSAQLDTLGQIDHAIALFLDGLLPRSGRPLTVIVTADHGGQGMNHDQGRPDEMLVPWIVWDSATRFVPTSHERLSIIETAPAIVALLGGNTTGDQARFGRTPIVLER